MKKGFIWALVGVALLGVVLFGWRFLASKPQDTAYKTLVKEDISVTVTASGVILGQDQVFLAFETSGRVKQQWAAEGLQVSQGDVLMELENSQQANQVVQQRLAYDRSRAEYDRLLGQDRKQAEEVYQQALVNYEAAEKIHEKKQQLYEAAGLSAAELDESERQLQILASILEQSRSSLSSIDQHQQQIARITVDQQKNLLENAQINLGKTVLRAPEDGVVLELLANAGEYVQAGQSVIAFMPAGQQLFVDTQLDEGFVGQVKMGQQGVVVSSAYPDRAYKAEVIRIASQVDEQRGTVQVRLSLTGNEGPQLPNKAAVVVQIILEELDEVLVLEKAYLRKDDAGDFVFIEKDGRAVVQYIQAVDLGDGRVLVVDGLEEGDAVLLSLSLKDGQRISLSSSGA